MPQNYGKNKDGNNRTFWQQLVSKHGVKKARKHYAGYRQKAGKLKYKGDVTRIQGKSGQYKNDSKGWHLERGQGPVGFVDAGRKGVNEEEKWETARADKKGGFLGGLLD
jgi:hypothetical protein